MVPANRLPYAPIRANKGDTLIFTFKAPHDMWAFNTPEAYESCNFTDAKVQASFTNSPTFNGTLQYSVEADTGFVSFACSAYGGGHCRNGQKIIVGVGQRAPLPPPLTLASSLRPLLGPSSLLQLLPAQFSSRH